MNEGFKMCLVSQRGSSLQVTQPSICNVSVGMLVGSDNLNYDITREKSDNETKKSLIAFIYLFLAHTFLPGLSLLLAADTFYDARLLHLLDQPISPGFTPCPPVVAQLYFVGSELYSSINTKI